jgi:DGQHR domain-containing protein
MDKQAFPCFQVCQKGETFFMTKMPIGFLAEKVNFHFRSPYQDGSIDMLRSEAYVQKMRTKLGIKTSEEAEGIQRRTDVRRIDEIKEFAENAEGIVFPTPIVLAFNLFNSSNYTSAFNFEEASGQITFSGQAEFTIIDGQHRLAGLVAAMDNLGSDFEMPVTLIINADLSVATQLFIDINGNQRKVNKSVIYDLYSNIDKPETDEIYKYVSVVKALNEREKSPLYQMIKRLGVGSGTISQSFLVEYIQNAYGELNKVGLLPQEQTSSQQIYSDVYIFFTFIKKIFKSKWSNNGSNVANSQLVKTNGIGALLISLPKIWEKIECSPSDLSDAYLTFIEKRRGFNWDSPNYSGTGKQVQRQISRDFLSYKIANS